MAILSSSSSILVLFIISHYTASSFVLGPSSSSLHTLVGYSHQRRQVYAIGTASVINGSSTTSSSSVSAPIESPNGVTSPPSPSSALNIRLSVEEKAKTVTSVCTSGTLCTISSSDGISGAPFGSFVDYVLDDEGNPVLLMNEMSMHTVNIGNNPSGMVTLFTQLGGGAVGGGPSTPSSKGQDISRCSITGTIQKLNPKETVDMDSIRMKYSLTHVYADQVMDSPKFAFYRIQASKVYFVGGFGVLAKWVSLDEYKTAEPDILAKEAGYIVSKLNREYTDDLFLTAEHLMGCQEIENIRVTNVDRLGMDIRVTTAAKRKNKLITDEFRIGFRIPVISVEDAKSEIIKIFQEAWEKGNGIQWGEDQTEIPGFDVPIVKIAADSLE